ncbi:MAG: hypothetical protein IPL26_24965 [Leptospiraceae bacterium]|nr:hypothetical protein [Leptospiraceae bacterium]
MKIKVNLRILENANKLIESIACCIASLTESEQAMGGKPATRHNLHLTVWLIRTQSFLFKKEMIIAIA